MYLSNDPAVKSRQRLEVDIVKRVVRTLLQAGFVLSLDNGGDGFELENSTNEQDILNAMIEVDDEHLYATKGHISGWVYFVYGNDGWDVISDYTINLEPVLEPVNKWIDKNF